ncbi:MAG: hypothetical protein R6W72_07585 [Desulfurivibrionaceae bacterium]
MTNRSYISFLRHESFRLRNFFKDNAPGIFLWEYAASQSYHMPLLAKAAGWKVIAMPHNLESLVPNQFSRISKKRSPLWFNEELKVLSTCDHIVTISREEQWLLRLYGINADFLPYYPPEATETALLSVRKHRHDNSSCGDMKKFLLLGTFYNPPTRLGMLKLVRHFAQKQNQRDLPYEIHIAGYGTEKLREAIDIPKGVQLHGEIEQSKLEMLLSDINGVIAHQPATTGCLTKIPEMLIAGIPLLLNANSARSWHGWPGIHIYENLTELFDLMGKKLHSPLCPEPPLVQEIRFSKKLKAGKDE